MNNNPPDSPYRTVKAKKAPGLSSTPLNHPSGSGGPTTFFLRSEREIEKNESVGRSSTMTSDTFNGSEHSEENSRGSTDDMDTSRQKTPLASMALNESSLFGVQSLEDTIASSSEADLSRTTSRSSASDAVDQSSPNTTTTTGEGIFWSGRKRRAPNPVHPKIHATGQRIISAEHSGSSPGHHRLASPSSSSLRSEAAAAELSSSSSPLRVSSSAANVITGSQPLTPLRMSPQPASAMPSTPRSGSPKSFRLSSDEEVSSVTSETDSQAIASSSSGGEDEEHRSEGQQEDYDNGDHDNDDETSARTRDSSMPQLVMPSLAMPKRRPFTERGRRIGKLKIMVVGPRGVGKTSLIQSICRVCDDIVHVDPVAGKSADGVHEINASTRPYPSWWTDLESRRMLLPRRKSMGEGVLERNITFIDTFGSDERVRQYFQSSLRHTASLESMSDLEMIGMLSGEGGAQIDVVLALFDAAPSSSGTATESAVVSDEAETSLSDLCNWTTVIPIITRADSVAPDALASRRREVLSFFQRLRAEVYLDGQSGVPDPDSIQNTNMPYATSSALADDHETIDASVLMSSSYLQPLASSDLEIFVHQLFDPENTARLRHLSATKFLLWRQQHLGLHLERQMQRAMLSPRFRDDEDDRLVRATSTGSLVEEPSKVLVPHASSSYYRSASPGSASDADASVTASLSSTPADALATIDDQPPMRQLRLAKWARDLQRSLEHERQRYRAWYTQGSSSPTSPSLPGSGALPLTSGDVTSSSDPLSSSSALLPFSHHHYRDGDQFHQQPSRPRPAKGKLGGALSVIDPRDPLGLLVLQRRGWLLLRLVGAGAALYFTLRSLWPELWEWDWSFGTLGVSTGSTAAATATASRSPSQVSVFVMPPLTPSASGSGSSSTWLESGSSSGAFSGGWEGWMEGLWNGFFGWAR